MEATDAITVLYLLQDQKITSLHFNAVSTLLKRCLQAANSEPGGNQCHSLDPLVKSGKYKYMPYILEAINTFLTVGFLIEQ